MSINAGTSTCPICGRTWLVTPDDDCMLPACGCYGDDTSDNNPNRPCAACGMAHALSGCEGPKKRLPARAVPTGNNDLQKSRSTKLDFLRNLFKKKRPQGKTFVRMHDLNSDDIMISDVSVDDCINIIRKDCKQNNPPAILVGAGISMLSGLPSGMQLKKTILEQIPRSDTSIRKFWGDKYDNDEKFRIRIERTAPEVIFGALKETQEDNLALLMESFKGFSPNLSHKILTSLYLENYWSVIATTNFENLIETALPNRKLHSVLPLDEQSVAEKSVFKLHGTCEVPKSQVTTLFDFWRSSYNVAIDEYFRRLEGKNLFICGYSGYDFDILIRLLNSNVRGIYWLCPPGSQGYTFEELPILFGRGPLYRVSYDIHQFFSKLGNHLLAQGIENTKSKKAKSFKDFENGVEAWGESIKLSTWQEVCGTLFWEVLEFPSSIRMFEAAIKEIKRSRGNDFKAEARLLRKISDSYIQMGRYDKANEYASDSINLLLKHDEYEQVGLDSAKSLHLFEKLGQYDAVKEMLRQLLPIYEQRHLMDQNLPEYAELTLATVNMFLRDNNREAAIAALRYSQVQAETLGSVRLYFESTFGLAQVLMRSDNRASKEEALYLAQRLYYLGKFWGNWAVQHRVVNLIPYIYMALDEPGLAGKWLAMTHNLSNEVQYPDKLGRWEEE